MKILVTGGAGYVGTTLIPKLLDRKYDVTLVDSLMHGGMPIIPFFKNKNFTFVKGDIRDSNLMKGACRDKDVIVHLAAIVGFPACRENPDLAEAVNVGGTRNVADSVSKNQYVLFGSTGSNYGSLVNAICTEKTPLNALSIYGKTKTKAEQILMDETTCTAYRFATAFGVSPRLRLDLLVNDLTYQAMKQRYLVIYEADFMRTFIDVADMANSFLFAIDNVDKMKNEVYNVGGDNMNHSKREVCEMIARETGAYVHYADVGEDADKRNYVVSYKKINELGFKTTVSVKEGVKELCRTIDAIKIQNPHANI